VAISSKDTPKILPKVDTETPPPISKSARNIESDRIEQRESANTNGWEPPSFLTARSFVDPNRVHIRSESECRRCFAVAPKLERRKRRRKLKLESLTSPSLPREFVEIIAGSRRRAAEVGEMLRGNRILTERGGE